MRSLFDVSFLIALADSQHLFHQKAREWWAANRKGGWASCPLTENAFIRILSQPSYAPTNRYSLNDTFAWLQSSIERGDHTFWPDDISLLSQNAFDHEKIHGPKQLTDIYLLALAVENKGRLVTFDQRIPLSAVHNAKPANLCVA